MAGIPPNTPNLAHSSNLTMAQGAGAHPSSQGAYASATDARDHDRTVRERQSAPHGNADHLPGAMHSARARALSNAAGAGRPNAMPGGVWRQGGVPVTLEAVNDSFEEDRARYFHLPVELGLAGSLEDYSELMTAASVEHGKTVIPRRLEASLSQRAFSPEKNEILTKEQAARFRKVYLPESNEWISRTAWSKRKADKAKRTASSGEQIGSA